MPSSGIFELPRLLHSQKILQQEYESISRSEQPSSSEETKDFRDDREGTIGIGIYMVERSSSGSDGSGCASFCSRIVDKFWSSCRMDGNSKLP